MSAGNKTAAILLVMIFMAGIARAEGMFGEKGARRQRKDPGGHQAFIGRLATDDRLAEQIGLSQKQAKHLQDELYRVRVDMVDLQADLQKAALEQARLLSAESIDEKAIMAVIEKTGDIRTQIAKLRIRPLVLIKTSLDPEQLRKAREGMRRHHQDRRRRMQEKMEEQRRKWGGDRRSGKWGERDDDRTPRWLKHRGDNGGPRPRGEPAEEAGDEDDQ